MKNFELLDRKRPRQKGTSESRTRSMNNFKLPDETHVSRVHLRTANLAGVLEFYQKVIGLRVIDRTELEASLSATGSTPAFLVLTEVRTANPRPHPATGLYHLAIRFPTRRDLAQAYLRAVAADYTVDAASEHGMGESIHLSDPDGNGVELYVDRPRAEWPMRNGRLHMFTRALDGSVATLQSPGGRLAECSSWHLRFVVYSSGDNLNRR